jgi:hypothetical protein
MAQEERKSEWSMNFRLLFRSLEHRNFRLFFMGQGLSLTGTWMQMTAVVWLVWRLSHSALLLGLVGFASRIPTFVMAPFVGVLVDRVDRHRLVIQTQVLSMAQALMLAGLMYSGRLAIWHVIALSLLLGFINALDVPARQSFLVQMLDRREDLTNAIALNSSMVNGARLIGPSIAGFLIAAAGEALCFLLNGLSYIAVIAGLLMMRVQPNARVERQTAVLENLREGFRYAFGFAPIRFLLILLALVSLTGASLHATPADLCPTDLARRRAHARLSYFGRRGRRARRGVVPGRAAQCARSRAADRLRIRRLRRRPDCAGAVAAPVADAGGDARDRARADGTDGLDKHRAADDRRRRQARAGDELLLDGVHGYGAAGQSACGHLSAPRRGATDGDPRWNLLHCRLHRFRLATSGPAQARPPDLRAAGNHPGSRRRSAIDQRHLSIVGRGPVPE